jgi:hypothetical protein
MGLKILLLRHMSNDMESQDITSLTLPEFHTKNDRHTNKHLQTRPIQVSKTCPVYIPKFHRAVVILWVDRGGVSLEMYELHYPCPSLSLIYTVTSI